MTFCKNIWASDWVIAQKLAGKDSWANITVHDVVVAGDDLDEIKNDNFFFKRAVGRLVKKPDEKTLAKYRVVKITLTKRIGTTNY